MSDDPRQIIEQNPLINFSLYTQFQVHTLDRIGNEIIGLSQDWTDCVTNFNRVNDLFWLWVLGAYEVIRTMHKHKDRFAPPLQTKIAAQKKVLAEIRMPFAKQELRGNGKPVYAELSAVDIDKGMIFRIRNENYHSSKVIENYLTLIKSIKSEEILKEMPVRRPSDE